MIDDDNMTPDEMAEEWTRLYEVSLAKRAEKDSELAERIASEEARAEFNRSELAKRQDELKLRELKERAIYNDVQWRIETILRAAGVKARLGGCGCCGSPFLEAQFPDGLKVDLDTFRFDTNDLPDQAS